MPLGQALGHVGRGWILQMLATAYRRKESVRTTVQPACMRACVCVRVCMGDWPGCFWGMGSPVGTSTHPPDSSHDQVGCCEATCASWSVQGTPLCGTSSGSVPCV